MEEGGEGVIRVSFRKGSYKPIYALLKRSLKGKAWEVASSISRAESADPQNRSVGISAILRTVESTTATRENTLQDALQDLEALMVKAKDMVRLAGELNDRLSQVTSASPAAANSYALPSTTDGVNEESGVSVVNLGTRGGVLVWKTI